MEKFIKIYDKDVCFGCTSCMAACPKDAIVMKDDEEGFFYPSVDMNKCINCGICKKKCPALKSNTYNDVSDYYAVQIESTCKRMSSSSGGVFSAIAEYISKIDGVIYGCTFDENFYIVHEREESSNWKRFRVSKYAQSDLHSNNIFFNIKKDLENKKTVLFTGTGCQIHGLKEYLNKVDTSQLVTIDIVCHGVPSPLIWKDYVSYVEGMTSSQINSINFRDKKNAGWHNSKITFTDKKNSIILSESQNKNLFFQLFFNHLILRPSCHRCPYANYKRTGEITIGDFWGIEKKYKYFDDDIGTSLVMVNNEKGEKIFNLIKNNLKIIKVKKKETIQPNLKSPASSNLYRNIFWKDYHKYGLKYVSKRFNYLERSCVDNLLIYSRIFVEKYLK